MWLFMSEDYSNRSIFKSIQIEFYIQIEFVYK